jgi:hypothetical protein
VKKSALKSKTLHFNLWVPVIYAILGAVGVGVPVSLPVVMALGNGLLRLVTKKPIAIKPKKEAGDG